MFYSYVCTLFCAVQRFISSLFCFITAQIKKKTSAHTQPKRQMRIRSKRVYDCCRKHLNRLPPRHQVHSFCMSKVSNVGNYVFFPRNWNHLNEDICRTKWTSPPAIGHWTIWKVTCVFQMNSPSAVFTKLIRFCHANYLPLNLSHFIFFGLCPVSGSSNLRIWCSSAQETRLSPFMLECNWASGW